MRRLQIDLYSCVDCPYMYQRQVKGVYSCGNAAWDENVYPNVVDVGNIPDNCPLPVAEPDRSLLTCECCDPAQSLEECGADIPDKFNAFSVRFEEVEGIPDAWLQGLSPAERKSISETDEERLERILEEEGIDTSETVAYDPFEDTLHGNK